MTTQITARTRAIEGKANDKLRRQGLVPAVLYGHGVKNINLSLDAIQLRKTLRQAGTSTLVDLVVDDRPAVKVLIHDIQYHPTKSSIVHIDFYQVKMTEKLQTDVELKLVGESPAVKELGGVLVRSLDKIKVECLPADLVPEIDVNIAVLKSFEDRIRVRDLNVPPGLTVLEQLDEVVASVTPPRSEAELEALSEKVVEDVSQVEKTVKPEETEEEVTEPATTEEPKK